MEGQTGAQRQADAADEAAANLEGFQDAFSQNELLVLLYMDLAGRECLPQTILIGTPNIAA